MKIDDIQNSIVEKFIKEFNPLIVEKAVKRLSGIKYLQDGVWDVDGDRKLGDKLSHYMVSYEGDKGYYTCGCCYSFASGFIQKGIRKKG